MATLAVVYAQVNRLGGTIDRGENRINFDAPTGKVWAATGTHTLAYSWHRGSGKPSDFLLEMVGDVNYGLAACETPDCDLCADGGHER